MSLFGAVIALIARSSCIFYLYACELLAGLRQNLEQIVNDDVARLRDAHGQRILDCFFGYVELVYRVVCGE